MYSEVIDNSVKTIQKGLFSIHLYQATMSIESTVTGSNFVEILSILGGFVTLITKIISWILGSY